MTDAVAAPADIQARRTTPNQVLAIVCFAMLLANLDLFIVNVALPDISVEFGNARLEDLSWVLNGYAIVYAALLVFFGRLSERYRRDRSFLLGTAVFTVASAACAIANDVPSLVAFRVVQAIGAALMTPTSLGLLLASFPPEKRARAIRTWAAIAGFAGALGPVVGGLLVPFSWRWIFLVNLPIGALALMLGWWKLPEVPGHDIPRPDSWGAAMVTVGIGALTLGLVKGGDWGWNSPAILACLIGSAAMLASFALHCARAASPMIDPALFRIRNFSGATLTAIPFGIAFGAFLISVVLWEQNVWHWTALQTGLAIAPGPFLVPVTSLLLGNRLITRFGAARVMAAGLLFFASGSVFYALMIDLTPSVFAGVGGILLTGIGVGFAMPTIMAVAAGAMPPSAFATGSGVVNMIRQTGMAIGVALVVAIIGAAVTPAAQLAAFHTAWWTIAGIALLGLLPLALVQSRH